MPTARSDAVQTARPLSRPHERNIASQPQQRPVASPDLQRHLNQRCPSLPLQLQDQNSSLSTDTDVGEDLDMSVSEFLAEIDERRTCSARQERMRIYSAVQDHLCPAPTRPETAPSRALSSKASSPTPRTGKVSGRCQHRASSASRLREPRQCLRATTPEANAASSSSSEVCPSPNLLTAAEACQLLGPQVCRLCDSGNRRSRELDRSQSAFHGLEVSAENFTSTLLMKRYFPHLSPSQQRELIAKGLVKKNLFLGFLHRCAESRQQQTQSHQPQRRSRATLESETILSDDEDEQLFITAQKLRRNRNSRPSVAPDGSSWSFFSNLADLDEKISSGRLPRRLVGDDPEENRQVAEDCEQRWKLKKQSSLLDTINPAFISFRKVNLNIETKMKSYYEPPLLQLEQQKVSNVFFAGQESEYKLAERLPDDLMPPGVSSDVDSYFNKTEFEEL